MIKINKRVCAAILSAALFISTVLSLSACSKKGDEDMRGADGETPFIGANGNWWIGDKDTGVAASGRDGRDGADGKNGKDGQDGADGVTPKFHYNSTSGNLQISYDGGGSWTNLANIGNMISDGVDGVSITDCDINAGGELLVSYSDGRVENLGVIVAKDGKDGKNGTDGKDGIGISNVAIDADGGLVVTLSNGTIFPLGNIMGTDGKDGKDGAAGKDGQNGYTPKLKIDTDTYEWFVSYDGGISWTPLGVSAAGNDGKDGIDGKDGKDGKDGNTPMLQINSSNNTWEVSYDGGNNWKTLGVSASGASGKDGETPVVKIVDGVWHVSYDNGTSWTSLYTKAVGTDGADGADGVGIKNAFINADGHLILLLTSGESIDCGKVSGSAGGESSSGSSNGDVYTDALEFYPLNGGTEYGVRIGKAIYLEEIRIPATYNGKPVTTILPNAFDVPEGETSLLKSICIPDSITEIRANAFATCTALEKIDVPVSVQKIESGAFGDWQTVIFAIPEDAVTKGQDWSSDALGTPNIIWKK